MYRYIITHYVVIYVYQVLGKRWVLQVHVESMHNAYTNMTMYRNGTSWSGVGVVPEIAKLLLHTKPAKTEK